MDSLLPAFADAPMAAEVHSSSECATRTQVGCRKVNGWINDVERDIVGILDGKVALITGGGSGIGQGVAYALAREGAAIAAAGRTEQKLATTCEAIKAFGGSAERVVCDVTQPEAAQNAIAQTVKAFGGLDILINCAVDGVVIGPLLNLSDEQFQLGLDAGPMAALRFMRAAHPHLKARGGGCILNFISSAAVRWDARYYGAYAAVKQAIRSLTRAAAAEWGADGIRALNIAPHAKSPALAGWIAANPDEAEAFFKTIPLGRVGECEEDIGRAVVFLVSPAAQYLTGATIPLDGGQAYFG